MPQYFLKILTMEELDGTLGTIFYLKEIYEDEHYL